MMFEGRDQVAVADLADEPMVALKAGYGLRHVTDRLCREAGFSPRIEIEVTELSTLRSLVAAGMGVAVVPAPQPGHPPANIGIPFSDPTASGTTERSPVGTARAARPRDASSSSSQGDRCIRCSQADRHAKAL